MDATKEGLKVPDAGRRERAAAVLRRLHDEAVARGDVEEIERLAFTPLDLFAASA